MGALSPVRVRCSGTNPSVRIRRCRSVRGSLLLSLCRSAFGASGQRRSAGEAEGGCAGQKHRALCRRRRAFEQMS